MLVVDDQPQRRRRADAVGRGDLGGVDRPAVEQPHRIGPQGVGPEQPVEGEAAPRVRAGAHHGLQHRGDARVERRARDQGRHPRLELFGQPDPEVGAEKSADLLGDETSEVKITDL